MAQRNFFYRFLFSGILSILIVTPNLAQAQIKDGSLYQGQLNAGAIGAGLTTAETADKPFDPRIFAGQVITVILQLLGTYFVVLIILAGYRLIKADGDTSKIEQAKETIQKAIVGLIIILASYSLASFASKKAVEAVNNASPKTGFEQPQ